MDIAKAIPNLLRRDETLTFGGVPRPYSEEEERTRAAAVLRVLSVDGVYVSPSESPQGYKTQSPSEIARKWEEMPHLWVYPYGGWSNGLTLWLNIWRFLSKDIPLNQLTVGDIIEGLKSLKRARIYFDYLGTDKDAFSGWWDMLRLKNIQVSLEEFKKMTLAYLLHQVGGAPSRWRLMVSLPTGEELLLPPSTSSPFPGCQFGFGFIASYFQPTFFGGKTSKNICNTTGARAVDSIALGNFLVRLRHGAETAREIYIEDACKRLEKIEKAGEKPPFTREIAERYAPVFVETQEPVVADIQRILANWKEEETKGFQYAVITTSHHSLATAVYKIPASRPYCWVETEKGWELAV